MNIQLGDSLLANNRNARVRLEAYPDTLELSSPTQLDENGLSSVAITSTIPGTYTIRAHLQLNGIEYLLENPLMISFTKLPQILKLSANPSSISVDTDQTVTIRADLHDSAKRPIGNTPIVFRSNFLEDSIQPSTALTNDQGQATVQLSSIRAGAHVISVIAPEVKSTVAVDFLAGACDSSYSKMSINPNTIFYGSSRNTAQITVTAYDRYQNPVPNVEVMLSSSEISDVLSAMRQTTDAMGTASFGLSAQTAGDSNQHLLQATLQNVTLNANLQVLPGADPRYCAIEVNPNIQIADNANVITATVTVRDNQDHPIPNSLVNFSASGVTTQLSNAGALSDSNGRAVCTYHSPVAQSENIMAQVQDIVFTQPISFVHGPENAALSYLAVTPDSQPANGTDALHLSAHFRDRFGNPVDSRTVNFTQDGSAGPFSTHTSTTDALGVARTDLVSSAAGTSQVHASTSSLTLDIQANFTTNTGYCNGEPNYTINTINVGVQPQNVVASDLNHDGCVDLIVTENGNDTVSILSGDCHGNFSVTNRYAVGSHPWGVAVVDFDQDGHTDLAVATAGDGNVAVLLGVGDGTFLTPIVYGAINPLASRDNVGVYTGYPFEIGVADFNEDGYPDLAVESGLDNQMVVLLGTGLGTLNPGHVYPTGVKPWGIAVADFNKDGHADIALPINNQGSRQNYLSLWTGIGDGNFKSQARYASQSCVQSVGVGDFNGDTFLDLAVPNTCASTVSIFSGGDSDTNLGKGPLAAAPTYLLSGLVTSGDPPYPTYFGALKLYDFDKDGSLDVVVTNLRPSTTNTALFLGSPAGALTFVNEAGTSLRGIAMELADINEDGTNEVIVATMTDDSDSGALDILAYNGATKTLELEQTIPFDFYPSMDVKVADFNRDGHPDLLITTYSAGGNLGVLLGQGNGNFNDAVYFGEYMTPIHLVTGDWNQDGNQDIAVAGEWGLHLLWGQGDGTFIQQDEVLIYGVQLGGIVSGDFNHDGIDDIVTAGLDDKPFYVLFGKGGGEFESPREYQSNYGITTSLTAVDVNGDGNLDLVAGHTWHDL